MLIGDGNTLSQALNLEFLAGTAPVNVLDVIGRGLKVAGGVVALGDEQIVLLSIVEGLVHGDGGTLKIC